MSGTPGAPLTYNLQRTGANLTSWNEWSRMVDKSATTTVGTNGLQKCRLLFDVFGHLVSLFNRGRVTSKTSLARKGLDWLKVIYGWNCPVYQIWRITQYKWSCIVHS